MVRENLARKFHPAGFEQPEDKRGYEQPENELGKRYLEWVKSFDENFDYLDEHIEKEYQRAVGLVGDLVVPLDEANALLVDDYKRPEKARKASGLFVSAVYNKLKLDKFIFDLDTDIDFIGYRFQGLIVNNSGVGNCFGWIAKGPVVNNGKTGNGFGSGAKGHVVNNGSVGNELGRCANGIVINNGNAGNWFGQFAKNLIVNNGNAGDELGWSANGPVVNNGEAGHWFGEWVSSPVVNNGEVGGGFGFNSKGLVVAIVEPKSYYSVRGSLGSAKRILKPEDCAKIPELKEYIDSIGERTRKLKNAKPEDVQKLLERLDAEIFEKEIRRLIGDSA